MRTDYQDVPAYIAVLQVPMFQKLLALLMLVVCHIYDELCISLFQEGKCQQFFSSFPQNHIVLF
jgi:hypothetical protein